MHTSSISKFYTENINRFFGFSHNRGVTAFDATLVGAVNSKWQTVHQSYLTSSEALVLGIKMFHEGHTSHKRNSNGIHDMFEYALSSKASNVEDQQLILLAMGIYYFSKALEQEQRSKQRKTMRLARHYMAESLKLNGKCSLTRLHLTLVHVALADINSALVELVRIGRDFNDEKIYKILFNIYEEMDLPNVALFYSLKASKAKNEITM
ncbi:hypothetical protein A9Q84_12420 [Halobacteriovorax marinus]|uniref:Uncharacterized protein n=1 Tax=Halobacteriovorax marinus TaxID=97084 RepID=A0A1Y5F857_9BACT|nr:hypothetical protein A9Q84_12420 [Halobacteriovorax marinus]